MSEGFTKFSKITSRSGALPRNCGIPFTQGMAVGGKAEDRAISLFKGTTHPQQISGWRGSFCLQLFCAEAQVLHIMQFVFLPGYAQTGLPSPKLFFAWYHIVAGPTTRTVAEALPTPRSWLQYHAMGRRRPK